jgi:hypothetical protein
MTTIKSLKSLLQQFKGISTLKKSQLQSLVIVTKSNLPELREEVKQIAQSKNLKGYSKMTKSEICNIIINENIKSFNKINKNNKNINKLKREHKKLLDEHEKYINNQQLKHNANKQLLERNLNNESDVEDENMNKLKQHEQLLANHEKALAKQQLKHQTNKQLLKRSVHTFKKYETNFRGTIISYKFNSNRINKNLGVEEFLNQYIPDVKTLLIAELKEKKGIKFQLNLRCEMSKYGDELTIVKSDFLSRMTIMINEQNIDNLLFDCKEKIIESFESFQAKGSGWRLSRIINLHVHINRYTPLRGNRFMQIPKFLKDTKAIINIQNTDNKCFLWSVLRSIHMNKKNNERYTDLKQYEETINMSGIEDPGKTYQF